MRKLLLGMLVSASFVACTESATKKAESTEQQTAAIEHIYKPSYTDNFKIGNQKNVLLAEQFHKAMFAKDFKAIGDMIADTAVFYMEDGATIKGKATMMEYINKNFKDITFNNYNIGVILPVVGENGHQWVLIWDNADITTADGKTQKVQWMDAFRYDNGKVVGMNGFAKVPKD
jgi:ketosteroid isomerase-like protein